MGMGRFAVQAANGFSDASRAGVVMVGSFYSSPETGN
jgi:hypothetical protein